MPFTSPSTGTTMLSAKLPSIDIFLDILKYWGVMCYFRGSVVHTPLVMLSGYSKMVIIFQMKFCNPFSSITKSYILIINSQWSLSRSLTHWGRVTHICVSNLTIIGSDNGLSPGRRQAVIWTSAGILLIGPLGTNFSEILIGIETFSLKKMHLKMSSVK